MKKVRRGFIIQLSLAIEIISETFKNTNNFNKLKYNLKEYFYK